MPDEYLPPNKILFIQNLPDSITKEALEALFRQCVSLIHCGDEEAKVRCRYPSMNEVRTIPGRKNIAFVEYEDENASSTARDALHNTKIQDMKIKVLIPADIYCFQCTDACWAQITFAKK